MPGLTLQEQQFRLQLAVPGVEKVTGGQAKQPAVFLSTSSHFPSLSCSPSQTGCFPSPAGRPKAWHHTCSWTGAHRQPPPASHSLHPATRKVLVKKASVPQPRVQWWLGPQLEVCAAWQPRAFLHQTTRREHRTPPASLPREAPNSFTFSVVCFQ